MPRSGIYVIANSSTGDMYVGSSSNLEKRKSQHFNALKANRHHSDYLQRSFNFHGASAFEFSVVEEVVPDKKMLQEREQYWIVLLKPKYNATQASLSTLGITYSPEALANIRAAQKRPETSRKKSASLKGRVHSAEALAKRSKTLTGRPVSSEVRANLLYYAKQPHSEERKQKARGRRHPDAIKQKIAKKNKLYWNSEEGKRRRREQRMKQLNKGVRPIQQTLWVD